MNFDSVSNDIAQRQYAQPHESGTEDVLRRAARYVSTAVPEGAKRDAARASFERLMLEKRFCPGGRILAGSETKHGNLLNCFVQDGSPEPEGTNAYALELAWKLAMVTKVGGGNGVNLDPFPPKRSYQDTKGRQIGAVAVTIRDGHPNADEVRSGTYYDQVIGRYVTKKYHVLKPLPYGQRPQQYWHVQPGDSIDSIWSSARTMVEHMLAGRHVLLDLSLLRAEGTRVEGSGGTSSGPASFAVEVFDNFARWAKLGGAAFAGPVATLRYLFAPTLRVVRQGGTRRGAGMATLSVWHGDLEDFITSKTLTREAADGDIGTFNISVLAPQDFMLGFGSVEDQRRLEMIAKQAWETGEPGLLFVDTINWHNPLLDTDGPITATNPCLTGDTKVLTLDGPRRFDELARAGQDVRVWTVDLKTNQPKISWMRRPHRTYKGAPILKIAFDSGLVVRATPDHGFYTTHRNRVNAEDLKPGMSVSAFNIHQHRDGHLRILRNDKTRNHQARQWFVHRLVAEHFGGPIDPGDVVHHLDGDPANNAPDNLEAMSSYAHQSLHYPERAANGFNGMSPNHKVVSVEPGGRDDVYNGMVEEYHNYVIVDPSPVGKAFVSGILSANCGEIPLFPGEPCDLGALNVAEYVTEWGSIDTDALRADAYVAAEFLDLVLDLERSPLPDIEDAMADKRRLGLGLMGLADALVKMKVPYDSERALNIASDIAVAIREGALRYTEAAARQRGTPDGLQRASLPGRRNIALLTVAPTGTTAMIMGTTSGIEPLFAPFIFRRIGTEYKQILHPLFVSTMRREVPDVDLKQLTERISENHGSVQGLDEVPASVQAVFRCAHDIEPLAHVRMQAAVQRGFDYYIERIGQEVERTFAANSISKTINLPNDATVQSVLDVFIEAHDSGCKGITVYRDGSRQLQVLNTKQQDEGDLEEESIVVETGWNGDLEAAAAASCRLDGFCD